MSCGEYGVYVNLEEGLSRVRGNRKLYTRMLGMFLDGKEFPELEEHLSRGDYEKAAASAHAIKGLTGNLSLTALFEYSTALLGEFRTGASNAETVDAYRRALEKTRECVRTLIAELSVEQ